MLEDNSMVVVQVGELPVPPPDSDPAFLVAFLLGALVVSAVAFYLLARLAAAGYRRAPGVLRTLDRVLPLVPIPTGMGGRVLAVVVGGVLLAALVYLGLLGATAALTGDVFTDDGVGPTRTLTVLPVENDTVPTESSPGPNASDADGDRLPDEWERSGETADGAALPDADPTHKDLYVQVNYGATAPHLTVAERRSLERTWAQLPVANPDGEPGVRLHLLEPDDADLATVAQVTDARTGHDAYYTADRLGARRCVYHQVVFGQVATGNTTLVASAPGYAVVVDTGRRPQFEGRVPWRTYAVTHGLLHNVLDAGDADDPHADAGWLASPIRPESDHLSPGVAERVNASGFADSAHFRDGVCAR